MPAKQTVALPERLGQSERLTRLFTACTGALLTVLAGWAALSRAGSSLVTLSYDVPFVVHRAGAADDLRIVYVDDYRDGALDRGIQAPLLDKLREVGARAVLYDIVFEKSLPATTGIPRLAK